MEVPARFHLWVDLESLPIRRPLRRSATRHCFDLHLQLTRFGRCVEGNDQVLVSIARRDENVRRLAPLQCEGLPDLKSAEGIVDCLLEQWTHRSRCEIAGRES